MKKGFLTILMCLIVVVSSGCMAGVGNVTINSDGTIDISSKVGISEATVNAMASTSDEVKEIKQQTKFAYNGITYYGEVKNQKVSSLEEFNKVINEENIYGTDKGKIELIKDNKGIYRLSLTVNSETADTSEMEANMEINGLSKAKIAQLMNDMVMIYTFNMPEKVVQTFGGSQGISINANKVTIDFLKLDIPTEDGVKVTYEFETQPVNEGSFIDVTEDFYCYTAINVLADNGLISGMGNRIFEPLREIKISEFCQMIANVKGLETGADETGYWPAKAINSCIVKGYIRNRGEIKPSNYDGKITREEAIAAIQLISEKLPIEGRNIMIQDIPDGNSIDDLYKDLIIKAYNSGITKGKDTHLTFCPKSNLTRGEVCQLFYNVNWTTKN